MTTKNLTLDEVRHIAKLAHLILTDKQLEQLVPQLSSVIGYISQIQTLATDSVLETSQVTGLENVTREDVVEEERMLTQKEALSNARETHDGYFVVDQVLEQ